MLWLGLIAYAFLLAPPEQPDTLQLIQNLSVGKWEGINPIIIALFNLMGIWPLIYSAMIIIDGRGQQIPAWLFVTASFAIGAFAVLPYLALRKPNQEFSGNKNLIIQLLDSRITGLLLTIVVLVLVAYGLQGDVGNFMQQWQPSRFIHIYTYYELRFLFTEPTISGTVKG